MLSGEGNENGEKTTIGLISKKATLYVSTLFCAYLCPCFARLQGETSRNFLVTRFMEEIQHVFLFTFFHCPSFSPWLPLAFLIFSTPLQNFHVVLPTKYVFFVFYLSLLLSIALFLVDFRWPVAYFLFISVFLFLCIPNLWT